MISILNIIIWREGDLGNAHFPDLQIIYWYLIGGVVLSAD